MYFQQDFQELKAPFDASPEDTAPIREWFQHNAGLQEGYREAWRSSEAVLARLGDHPAAHLDLASRCSKRDSWTGPSITPVGRWS